ncbi:hypothetical protein FRB90_012800 [Tulasnella sp. 427]|nr:hypothetical protein FRB90_012800 [Tulasnella sp. 427]
MQRDEPFLPPELFLYIIEQLDDHCESDPYRLCKGATQCLINLSRVNRPFFEWATGVLHRRVCLKNTSMSGFRAAITAGRRRQLPQATKWLHIQLQAPVGSDSFGTHAAFDDQEHQAHIREIITILHTLRSTVRNVFLELDVTEKDLKCMVNFRKPASLQAAIASLSNVEEFFFAPPTGTFIETFPLPSHKSPLRRLGLLHPRAGEGEFGLLPYRLRDLEHLILVSPVEHPQAQRSPLHQRLLGILGLFLPPAVVKRITVVGFQSTRSPAAVLPSGEVLNVTGTDTLTAWGILQGDRDGSLKVLMSEKASIAHVWMELI